MPFPSIATSSFDRISPGSKHFFGSGCWPNCVSHCCVRRVSLTEPKHLDSLSNFHMADVTSRPFSSHFVSGFSGLDPSHASTPCVIEVSSEKAAVRWMYFAGRSALLPMRRALSPPNS